MRAGLVTDWEASNNDTWTVPIGGQIGQISGLGKQPTNISAGAYHNVGKPEFGSDWTLRLQWTLLFPKER